MQYKKENPIIQWWVGSGLPSVHIWMNKESLPKGKRLVFRLYYRKWLIHPLRRKVAKYYLLYLRKFSGLKVVGITGSAGKTTTKDMVEAILSSIGNTVASYKNIDPVYNIPTTIFRCRRKTDYLILEMGVEYPGEMDFYTWLANPDVGVITNIFPTHLEYFGSVGGVFDEKTKLVKNLNEKSTAVLNIEDELLNKLEVKSKIIWYGNRGDLYFKRLKRKSDRTLTFNVLYDNKIEKVELKVLGDHLAKNALAAISCGLSLGISLKKSCRHISKYKGTDHRMNIINHKSGAVVIDDSYNNNPEAAKSTLSSVKKYFRNKNIVVVFGDMLELGEKENSYHKDLGIYMKKLGINHLICVGEKSKLTAKSFGKNSIVVVNEKEVDLELKKFFKKGNAILVKGSRSIGLDNLIERITKLS